MAQYNEQAVDQAIKQHLGRIGKRDAQAIHRLLKGRHEAPRMMPGHAPYDTAELRRLYAALGAAADGDPGEQNEAADERAQD